MAFLSFLRDGRGESYHGGGDIVGDIRRNTFGVGVVFRVEVCSDGDALEAVEDPGYENCQCLDLKFVMLRTGGLVPVLRMM